MTSCSCTFKVGTRESKLSVAQTEDALVRLRRLLPGCAFDLQPFSSPGDRDQGADLRSAPGDFFSRDVDDAVRSGTLDFAVHSAKDLPDPVASGLDWFWLPWREDPRDVLVLPAGKRLSDLPERPRLGVSSARREAWCRNRFPGAELLPVRGVIEARLEQLDAGRFDLLVMAAAALLRLGLQERISEWIPLADLEVPDGQGALAVTFRVGDLRMRRLRSLFIKPVTFAGAGAGRAGTCTLETAEALTSAEVCLHDALLDPALLERVSPQARCVDVGKRCGGERTEQPEINRLLTEYARRGLRVVRLKGGDPGLFGRLAEELTALETFALPYRVLPGVSSLLAATTGTGMLLTRRGESRGFCVLTPRAEGGAVAPVTAAARAQLPMVIFMAAGMLPELCRELLGDGLAPATPAAVVFDAGSLQELVVRGTCADLAGRVPAATAGRPGLVIIGSPAAHALAGNTGALAGRRVLLTCSRELLPAAERAVLDLGGVSIPQPLIRLVPIRDGIEPFLRGERFDWLVLTSPSAAMAMLYLLRENVFDLRRLPGKILTCGPGANRVLAEHGLQTDAAPTADFGTDGLLRTAREVLKPGDRVLRLRSDAAGGRVVEELEKLGASVTDVVVCRNEPEPVTALPPFDAVFFASTSAVNAYLQLAAPASLEGKTVVSMGKPTAAALAAAGISGTVRGAETETGSAIFALAVHIVCQSGELADG